MLTDKERSQAADILIEAEKTRKPALQLSKTFPNIEVEDAYAI
jgi:2-oxo-hept-3-ene-1,7-dioate hydratase